MACRFLTAGLFAGVMGYFVYILQSEKDGTYYVGHTRDVDERLRRHNSGRSTYTKALIPWKLVYQEVFKSKGDAMNREKEIKAKKVRDYIEHLVRTPPGQ